MPQHIDFDDLDWIPFMKARRDYLINIWRCMPGTTDRVHLTDEEKLKEVYTQFMSICGRNSPIPTVFEVAYHTCGYPWTAGVNVSTKRGEKWVVALMFAALKLDGFLGEWTPNGSWMPMMVSWMKAGQWAEEVKDVLKAEVVDEWLPVYDRLFEEAKKLADSTPTVI